MPEVTIEWLNNQAKQLVKKYWGLNHIPNICLTTRDSDLTKEKNLDWDNYAGYYCSGIETVVLNNENNARYTLRSIKRTLLHELCHWYLHTSNQPWRDSDERFARELIRVGLGRRHNKDEQASLAAKKAWESKANERFEIIERNEDGIITVRLKHHRKNVEDFKRDLANTLIKAHNERTEDETIYPGDIADMMCKLYGYKVEPIARIAIEISETGSYLSGAVGDRSDLMNILTMDLDIDYEEADSKLKDFDEDELLAASEDAQ